MDKHCTKCGQDKPLTTENWLPRKDSKDGYRGICRRCWYAQQRPGKRRHYQRHAERIRAERKADRQRRPNQRRMADLRYHLKHREKRIAYNRRYYWQNHERILAQKRWYSRNVRPLRIQFGSLPTDHIDQEIWQRQQDGQQAREIAMAIIGLMMQALTENERQLLMTIEAHDYDVEAALTALNMGDNALQRIRSVASSAQKVIMEAQ